MKLNLGCGKDIKAGWVNIDCADLPGVDNVINFDSPNVKLPFPDSSFETIYASHVLEHIMHILPLMAELWRVAKPSALFEIKVPHAGSDDAFADPTHVRFFVPDSFYAFGQPYYWRADYGYRGDWKLTQLDMLANMSKEWVTKAESGEVMSTLYGSRNVVKEMHAYMVAVKPIRSADKTVLDESIVKPRLRPLHD